MIDIFSRETLLTLTEAAKLLPPRRRGKRPAFSTIWRWATSGVHGIVLDTIMVGGTRCTTASAIQNFCDALTAAADAGVAVSPPVKLSRQRQRDIEAAEARLARAGVRSKPTPPQGKSS